jgi:hypothetical protein
MSDPFKSPASDPRPVDAMSRAQVGLVMGLESILHAAGLVLVCPKCVADGHPDLDTNNAQDDEIWKIDCRCRRRRIARTESRMVASGWLLLMVDDLLRPLSLDVRCPSERCRTKPLTIRQSANGLTVTVNCHCGGEYKFQRKQSKPN